MASRPAKPPLAERLLAQRERHHRRSKPLRALIVLAGFTVVGIGIAMLALPGPAFVVIPAGLAMLSLEFAWAERLLHKAIAAERPGAAEGAGVQPDRACADGDRRVPGPDGDRRLGLLGRHPRRAGLTAPSDLTLERCHRGYVPAHERPSPRCGCRPRDDGARRRRLPQRRRRRRRAADHVRRDRRAGQALRDVDARPGHDVRGHRTSPRVRSSIPCSTTQPSPTSTASPATSARRRRRSAAARPRRRAIAGASRSRATAATSSSSRRRPATRPRTSAMWVIDEAKPLIPGAGGPRTPDEHPGRRAPARGAVTCDDPEPGVLAARSRARRRSPGSCAAGSACA